MALDKLNAKPFETVRQDTIEQIRDGIVKGNLNSFRSPSNVSLSPRRGGFSFMASPTNNMNSKSVFDVAGRSGRFHQGPFMHPPSPDAPATGSSADVEQPQKAAADSSSNP